ncbi:ATP-dependent RNA helicase, partial [Thermus scotoductus]
MRGGGEERGRRGDWGEGEEGKKRKREEGGGGTGGGHTGREGKSGEEGGHEANRHIRVGDVIRMQRGMDFSSRYRKEERPR